MEEEITECALDDDGGPVVMAVEAPDSSGHRQSLWIRVGPVFYGSNVPAREPGIWIEYQPDHLKSNLEGPVLITPAVWRQLSAAVEWRLRKKMWPSWLLPFWWIHSRITLEVAIIRGRICVMKRKRESE